MNHLRFLRYVDEIARSGSIRAAAERLHVAPSAVNRRLQDIEEELDAPLFERLPRGMRLTAAGEMFITYVRARQAELDQVRSNIEELKGLRRGTVKLICSQGLAPSFVPQAISSFRRQHPLVEFRVQVGDHVQALSALRAMETDLILVFNLDSEPDLHPIVFHDQKLLAVMHRDHPLAQRSPSIRLADCTAYPLALPNRDTAGRQMLERFVLRRSIDLKPLVESNSFELLRGCLYHQEAVTFQFESGAVTDGGQLVTREIDTRRVCCGWLVGAAPLPRCSGGLITVVSGRIEAGREHGHRAARVPALMYRQHLAGLRQVHHSNKEASHERYPAPDQACRRAGRLGSSRPAGHGGQGVRLDCSGGSAGGRSDCFSGGLHPGPSLLVHRPSGHRPDQPGPVAPAFSKRGGHTQRRYRCAGAGL